MNTTTEIVAPVVEKKVDMRKGPNNWRNRPLKAAAPIVEKEATPPASDAEESDAEKEESEAESSADEAPAPAPVAKSPSVKVLPMAEYKRLLEIEKMYNEMKPKYEVFVKKDIEKKAKANEASKRSKAKKSKETKEVKAKLEERVEKLEKLVIKAEVVEEEAEESDAEAEE